MSAVALVNAAFAAGDARGGVWLACAAASAVLPLVPPDEPRPTEAIRLARAWARGEAASVAALYDAASAAWEAQVVAAARAARAARTAQVAARTARAAAASAALAAARAARAAAWASDARAESAALVARAALDVAALLAAIDVAAAVRREAEPIEPSLADVRGASAGPAVIWDVYASELPPVRIGSLGDALERARVLGLDWRLPVERALAERLPLGHPAWQAL